MRRSPAYPLWSVFAPRAGTGSLQDQLSRFLRESIVEGALPAGARLPASRELAREMTLSRNTVALAYERLTAEGLLEPRAGSGTYVSERLARSTHVSRPAREVRRATRASAVATLASPPPSLAGQWLTPGLPDLGLFPAGTWARLAARYWRGQPLLGYPEPGGLPALREAVAGYIGATRGVSCTAEQVVVASGAQSALLAAALALADPGEHAWVENPGYAQSCRALLLAGIKPVAVPVDDDGLVVAAGRERAPRARLVLVSPSHQYPLGVTMTLARRLELLAWAREADAWIVEDDYDGEYRYEGAPVQALKSLDRDGRVIYVGTLSKLLAPGLRLGFLILPDALIDTFHAVRDACDHGVATPLQAICAEFIASGHLGTHIRRTRTAYATRRDTLLAALEAQPGVQRVTGQAAGLHLTAHFASDIDDQALMHSARERDIGVKALSGFYVEHQGPSASGLLLGFANTPADAMQPALQWLRRGLATAEFRLRVCEKFGRRRERVDWRARQGVWRENEGAW